MASRLASTSAQRAVAPLVAEKIIVNVSRSAGLGAGIYLPRRDNEVMSNVLGGNLT